MNILKDNMIKALRDRGIEFNILKGNFGLEKENVRVKYDGIMSHEKHPAVFGPKLDNPYIQTDFAENQVEMITPVCKTIERAYSFLDNINNIVTNNIRDELLWPQSSPPIIEGEIPIAEYDNSAKGRTSREYREKLAVKYGKNKQLISGIHYNFSLSDDFIKNIYVCLKPKMSLTDFRTELYLKICRNFMQYRWFLIYILGASPVLGKSYFNGDITGLDIEGDDYFTKKHAISLRNSTLGYKNAKDFDIRFSSTDNYCSEIRRLVKQGDLINEKEYYNPIRLKSLSQTLVGLEEGGVDYIEVRLVDINPLTPQGITLDDMYSIHLFLLYCLLKEDISLNNTIANINHECVASNGLDPNLRLWIDDDNDMPIRDFAMTIIDELYNIIELSDRKKAYLKSVVDELKEMFDNPSKTKAYKLTTDIERQGYIDYHLDLARLYREMSMDKEYSLKGYEELELSTQIVLKAAIRRGINFKILDAEENFVRLEKNGHIEYIKQATKTSLDRYVTVLMMENKLVTNKVLRSEGIRVPDGRSYNNLADAMDDYNHFKDMNIVIKPNTTNHGIGISILKDDYDRDNYRHAAQHALSKDKTILIEEFISGKEYRFFIINDEIEGVLHRVPANVRGDGVSSVRDLVNEKNKDPLRGKGYKTPLEKIELGESEEFFLKLKGMDFDYVPNKDEIVYLRENTNISTGGDSIDYTGLVDESYSLLAVECAKRIGAKICGVDMIISDIDTKGKKDNYAIIELNFNPAMHMHCYPYRGERRFIEDRLLDALGF